MVIPTLNAGATLGRTLAPLVPAAMHGLVKAVILADGGSTDDTLAVADDAGCEIIRTERGRGRQLRVGCSKARTPWLLVLHADTRLAEGWAEAAARHMAERPERAGWFRFRLDDLGRTARLWEAGVALRNGAFALPYGDQGLLISRRLYDDVGGYPPWTLMEDVELARRLGRRRLSPLPVDAVTSAERYRREGYLKRSVRNWALVARWRLGEDPERLAREYR